MRRLYVLIPDVPSAHAVVNALRLMHIPEAHLHLIARDDTPLGDLPAAGIAQTSDLIPALERGLALGGVLGSLAGLVVIAIPGLAVVSAGPLLLGIAAVTAATGGWISSMIGVSVDSPRLKRYEQAIQSGQILLLVDVPQERVAEVTERIEWELPHADRVDIEPDVPAFP